MPITIQTIIQSDIKTVWDCWNNPKDITGWAFASNDWEAPHAENNLIVGGAFKIHMAAKDKSNEFDFEGVYSIVNEHQKIEYDIPDGRHVAISFEEIPEGIKITEQFDPEHENSEEMQKNGWQAILNNFKTYVESKERT